VTPPLVSILIPAYNAQEWVAETIASALAQTWPRKEIILVDDGSKDNTLDVVRRYASKHVRVVSQENQGAAAARNTAFSHSQGDYIQWLDADDLLAADKIHKQLEIAERLSDPHILLSSPWGHFMYRQEAADFNPTRLWQDLSPVDWTLTKWSHHLHMQTATWLVSRELTESAGPWNTTLLGDDDGEYFARIVLRSRGIRFVPDARVYYRVVGTNRLSYIGRSNEKMEAQLRSMVLQVAFIRSIEDSPRVRSAIVQYLQSWLHHFYPERPDLVKELEALASEVGGALRTPQMSWKYAWIDRIFGRVAAKRAQLHYNSGKSLALRSWDRVLYRVLGRRSEQGG
jgi:glycosyltransferase involved in cell wall biosynthesis